MVKIPEQLQKIEKMSWDELRKLANKELSTIPKEERIVFEHIFGLKWPQFVQMVSSLAGKSYAEILPIQNTATPLGDLTSREVVELATYATLNKTLLKSAKIEYWLLCRSLHTK
jgi:hypothetical protein